MKLSPIPLLEDFVSLLFPRICQSCEQVLARGEDTICLECEFHLPQTDYHTYPDNPVAKHFWGRVKVEEAGSFYLFKKGTKVQHLLHQLKYKGRKEIGVKVGKMYGQALRETGGFKSVDVIVPVPLFPAKERLRGFNQSDVFAQGLSESLEIPWSKKILKRVKASQTQTRKNRFERWENVDSIFKLRNADRVKDKHILIVDDVITTGSTMEACIRELAQGENTKVSIATMACAEF
jgi:ComF family protein